MTIAVRRLRRLLICGLTLVGVAAAGAPATFNVRNYGARPDGSTDATAAINSAIQAAKAAGGGTVIVPPGTYVCGPIKLVSNLVFKVDAGATLRFPARRLPYTKGRVQGIECLTPVPLLGGHNLKNVTITGGGILTTDNSAWLKLMGGPTPRSAAGSGAAFGPEWDRLLALLRKKTPQPRAEYLKAAPHLRPDFIGVMDCRNVIIRDIHVVGSPFWTIHLLYSRNVVVRDVTLRTVPGAFTGGICVDSSRDIRIAGCDLDDGGDAIALKAGRDADGLRVNRPTEDVTITGCVIHRSSGAVVIGSETSGWIRNVTVGDIVCDGTRMGINLTSGRGRGGGVADVRIDNVVMNDVGRAISVSEYFQTQGKTPAGVQPVTKRTPTFRDIAISHITITDARGAPGFGRNSDSIGGNRAKQLLTISVDGLPERPIQGLRISNVVASGRAGLQARCATGLDLRHVQMNARAGPAFVVRDCRDATLDDVSTRRPHWDEPVVRLEHCPGAVVRNCRAVAGTNVFLSIPPGGWNNVTLTGNTLMEARRPTVETEAEPAEAMERG